MARHMLASSFPFLPYGWERYVHKANDTGHIHVCGGYVGWGKVLVHKANDTGHIHVCGCYVFKYFQINFKFFKILICTVLYCTKGRY